jgi:GT2 family glycosyltransferase/glycosyltransferase involved in cell wall biosynthesis
LNLKPKIKVAFASGTDELNRRLIERMREIFPELPLWVVSDWPPEDGDLKWIRYRVNGSLIENLARSRAELAGFEVRLAGVMLVPDVPFRRMRLMALLLAPRGFLAFNENLNDFMLRPRCAGAILRHLGWRVLNLARWGRRAAREADWRALFWWTAAGICGWLRPGLRKTKGKLKHAPPASGISLVIPSRDGRHLLEAQLPGITRELEGEASEIIVVDNGSHDGTAEWLATAWPRIQVEISPAPLSFAGAVNRGIARARYSHVCLLNNDMLVDPGFFAALVRAFSQVPDLFSATAQIRFPAGARREETGKTVMRQLAPEDFPVRCDPPLPGEDLTWVLYGSGGCTLYDAAKLHALGGVDEAYAPAYVEDLDLGYRAWQRGWPSVYVADAAVEHRHRATTSRFYGDKELERILEINYLKFLARAIGDRRVFRRLWGDALRRLKLRQPALLREACVIALRGGQAKACPTEEAILALNSGAVAVFPGRAASGKPRVLIVSPYLPFPLSHGGAVRIYNLMRRAAADFDQILVAFTGELATPPLELLEICAEVILVQRAGSHSLPSTGRPDVVEEYDSAAFHAVLRQAVRQWRPALAQLEFTQMAQYAPDCAPARTLLVEHDITFDLHEQLLRFDESWDHRRQLSLWRRFETEAWRGVDCVVTMSERDRRMVAGARAVTLANGVDPDRFRPEAMAPEPGRLLFIGSFAHLPNLMALEFFLNQVWPLLDSVTLDIIAGARPEYFLDRYRDRVRVNLERPGIEVEGFVADVRPAYRRATLVLAPLVASAGTNIKVLEAMAMGKAVVSTPAGVHGLDLEPGLEFVLAATAPEMAAAIRRLLADPAERGRIEAAARARVEREFGWDSIATQQQRLYREFLWASGD